MLIKTLFENEKKYLEYFFNNIDLEKVQTILDKLISCKSKILFTGIGKSGFIANKVAMTMLSTGTNALYLPATDALHGDIAVVEENDIFFIFSKSGETEELINLLPYIKKKKAQTIAVVSNKNSRLAKKADFFIELPLEKELCPFNLAPTISTTVQLIFGDVLTVALMQKKEFSLTDYAINHPAGAIGKQITLRVEDLMINKNNLPFCSPKDLIKDVLVELSQKKCGCVLIVDKDHSLKGIFTDGDLRRAIQTNNNFLNHPIQDLMTIDPLVVKKTDLAIDAMRLMENKNLITVLPVLDQEKVIGLIRMHDIIQAGLTSL